MRTRRSWLLMPLALALALAGKAAGQGKTLGDSVVIPPEPLGLPPGASLSVRTLVQRPPGLKDVRSWTIETKRHRGYLMTSALSPDGKHIATGGLDGIVRIWDVDTGEFVRALVGHTSYVYGLAWSADGRHLASAGSFDATARLWDATTGMPLRVLKGHKGYTQLVAWSSDGKSVAVSGGTSGFITHWNVLRPEPVNTIEIGAPPSAIAWAPDSQRIAVAGQNTGVAVWDVSKGKVGPALPMPKSIGYAVAWSPDGKTLAAGGAGKTLLWDPKTNQGMYEAEASGVALAWSPDGKALAIGTGAEIEVRGGDFAKAMLKTSLAVNRLGWARDKQIVGADAAAVTVVDSANLKTIRTLQPAFNSSLVWTPNRPVLSDLHSVAPTLWDPASGKQIAVLKGHAAGVGAVAWSRDGKLLATASADKTVKLWDAAGKLAQTLQGHEGPVQCLSWSEGKTLASGGADKTIRVWTVGADKARVLQGHRDAVTALAWSRDGGQLASGGAEDEVHLWSATGTKPASTIRTMGLPRALSWSAGSKTLAVGMENGSTHFFTPSGKELGHYEGGGSPPAVTGLAWTADAVVVGRANHTIQVLRPGSSKPLLNFTVPSPVPSVGVSGGSFVAGGADRAARWYDVQKGDLKLTLLVEEKQAVLVSAFGHFKAPDEAACDLVYVVQTNKGQETLTIPEFAARFKWKNNPGLAQAPSK